MPSIPSRRSRAAESDSGDDDEPTAISSGAVHHTHKRRRRDQVIDEASSPLQQELEQEQEEVGEQEQEVEESQQLQSPGVLELRQPATGRQTNGHLEGTGYQPGAIRRVKLRNFVTYSAVEFFPGPNLNMVIGPNGSGKSSLVCAICLGLGWGSQHLGRARDVSEFVKTGCREATIEIELEHDHRTRRNPIITRIIKKGDSKSFYTLNGQSVTGKNIQTLARSMNIQIDNLCQFLPQDKVVEFAAMTPIELLQSTQQAAAPGPEMLQQHHDLKKLRGHQRQLLATSRGDREVLHNLRSRQDMQRDDVERLRQRHITKQRITWMEKCRPIPRYATAKQAVKTARDRRARLAADLAALKAQLGPTLRQVNGRQEHAGRVRQALQHGREVVEKQARNADHAAEGVADLDGSLRELDGLVEAEKRSVRTKREDQKRIRGLVARINKQIDDDEPEPFDAKLANNKMAEINARRRHLADSAEDLNGQLKDLKARGQTKVAEQRTQEDRLASLETQAGQQEHKLQTLSADSYQGWKWVQEHQDEFEHHVYGPPLVECGVRDPRYASALESVLRATEFKAFTVQSSKDFSRLQQALTTKMGLFDISIRSCSDSSMDQYRAPLSREELRSCGMDGWAIDFLKGPDVVLAMLCGSKALYATAIALQEISQEQFEFLQNSGVRSWVVSDTSFNAIRRAEYGAAGTSIRTTKLQGARFWTDQPVDSAAGDRLQRQIQESTSDIAAIKDELRQLADSKKELGAEHHALGEELEALRAEKDDRQRAMTIFKALPTRLAQEEQKLTAIDDHMEGVRDRVEKILQRKDKALIDKVHITLRYATAVAAYRKAHDALLELELQHLEAKSDYDTLRLRNEHINATLKAKQDEEKAAVEESTREATKARELVVHVKQLATEAKNLAQAGDPVWDRYLAEFGGKTADELEADIESERARLELTHESNNGNIIQEYEERQRRIDKLECGLEKFHQEKRDLAAGIAEIRNEWEPQLDALVAKISDAFSDSFARIGCAGQVTVFKASSTDDEDDDRVTAPPAAAPPPATATTTQTTSNQDPDQQTSGNGNGLDFAHWALHILVKFRSNEPLTLLDSHRQSGGERAVSTIFYLMALQSLSRAPFRVVDEINQGMDPRNERMVHGRIVDVACGRDPGQDGNGDGDGDADSAGDEASGGGGGGGQYFLITPKLLSGLKYRRGMHVLNIVSGAVIPAPPSTPSDAEADPTATATATTTRVIDFEVWIRRARELGLGSAASIRKRNTNNTNGFAIAMGNRNVRRDVGLV